MRRWVILGVLLVASSIAGAVSISHQRSLPGWCDLDGSRIDPLYEVTVVREGAEPVHFACVVNACIWLARNGDDIASIWVTDEDTGERVAAEEAFYVVSSVVTTRHAKNRIHVFRRQETAENHARTYAGTRIHNPLRVQRKVLTRTVSYRPDPIEKGIPGVSSSFPEFFHQPTHPPFFRDHRISVVPANSFGLLRGFSRPPYKPPRGGA